MKKFLLVCLVALVSSTGFAQNSNLQDVIYLKNGSVIRGAIIEQVPGESLKIETRDGNIFVYQMDEISKMTREHNSISSYSGSNRLSAKSAGYAGSIEAGYGIGVSGYGGRFEFDVVNGYQFNPYFYLGFGIGVNVWTNGSDIVTLPFFAHLRANFMDRPVSPFFALSAGYNVSVTSDVKGGFMVEPALGVAFRTSNRNAVTLGIGYSGQRYKEEGYRYYYGYYDETLWISAIRIKVGFTF
ncbi:hypothetical protein [uncultured Rikenella sp.]|uniref:hypothetical protein n=1 Tax=uncultured Rikenella sp. TaxID=368003 RepID=UPI0026317743|nr:hypothetical protein [uncultured Rikenella sp.]